MSKITKIHAREILDSRGNPTVEADVYLESGATACSYRAKRGVNGFQRSVGTSRRRQKRFLGKGVLKAVVLM